MGEYLSSNDHHLYNVTSSECVCNAFYSTATPNYQIANYFTHNRSCLLFYSSLSVSSVRLNVNSTLFYLASQSEGTTDQAATTPASVDTSTTFGSSSSSQCQVLRWNSTGVTMINPGSGLNQVSHSYDLHIGNNNSILYIADTDNNRIVKWLPGSSSGILVAGGQGPGSNASQLNNPREIYVDENDNLYVADNGNHRIQYFPNGSFLGQTVAGNGTAGSANNLLGQMLGLAVDREKNIYVSEYDNARVAQWSFNRTFGITVAGNDTQGDTLSQLNVPSSFYLDRDTKALFIPSQAGNCIMKWIVGNSSGEVVAGKCGVAGNNESLLNSPKCVTFDQYQNMYVIDGVNGGRILMFCPNSVIGIILVNSGLNNPISIAVDMNLNLYVSDWNNNRIVKYFLL